MRTPICSMGASLDGFIARPEGEIDFSAPDEDLHRVGVGHEHATDPRCRGARHSVPGQTGVQETASLTLSDATVEASLDHSRDLLSQHDANPILSGDRPGMRGKRNSAAGGVCKFLASAWPERARIPLTGGRRIGLVARGKESGHRSAHGTAANERVVA